MSVTDPITVLECPTCGRLWLLPFPDKRSTDGSDPSRSPHWGSDLWVAELFEPDCDRVTRAFCSGIPEAHYRPDVLAAYAIGGKEAALQCVTFALRNAIAEMEERKRGRVK